MSTEIKIEATSRKEAFNRGKELEKQGYKVVAGCEKPKQNLFVIIMKKIIPAASLIAGVIYWLYC